MWLDWDSGDDDDGTDAGDRDFLFGAIVYALAADPASRRSARDASRCAWRRPRDWPRSALTDAIGDYHAALGGARHHLVQYLGWRSVAARGSADRARVRARARGRVAPRARHRRSPADRRQRRSARLARLAGSPASSRAFRRARAGAGSRSPARCVAARRAASRSSAQSVITRLRRSIHVDDGEATMAKTSDRSARRRRWPTSARPPAPARSACSAPPRCSWSRSCSSSPRATSSRCCWCRSRCSSTSPAPSSASWCASSLTVFFSGRHLIKNAAYLQDTVAALRKFLYMKRDDAGCDQGRPDRSRREGQAARQPARPRDPGRAQAQEGQGVRRVRRARVLRRLPRALRSPARAPRLRRRT